MSSLLNKVNSDRLQQAAAYYVYLLPYSIRNKFRDNLYNGSNISIFAVPRGGSTWLARILSRIPGSSLVWEPLFRHPGYQINFLNPFAYPHVKKLGIWWNQHIPEDEEWPEVENYFRKLFNREIVNLKLYRYNQLSEVPQSDYFIFKFCFGNLLLPWLAGKFQIKPILLVRHPCAVVASQLNYGAFDYMKKNPGINVPRWTKYHDHYLPFKNILRQVKSPAESLAVRWAMAHVYPVKHKLNNRSWLTVSYESLLTNPEFELKRIRDWLDIDFEIEEDQLLKASFTSHKDEIEPGQQISNWKSKLDKKQIEEILNINQEIGIDFYGEDVLPDLNILYGRSL